MAEFSRLLSERRSIRNYKDEKVDVELVREIIQDSIMAPNSGNRQPWRFSIINDRDLMRRISDESKRNILADISQDPDSNRKRYEGALKNPDFNVFYNAPCLVFIFGDKAQRSIYVDCALAASYFMLAAADRGLGTCWVALGGEIRDPELLGTVGLSETDAVVAPIILGWPA
ncbi:MAG: nitroreductase family protein, partial [Gammaproteobacteria bacterium]|nr:nitroreductase family protein [Gammaproteobacteria bacterium]